ncbi:protein suppressor of sable isoform X3 [Dendroctonus ponderosae]|uniref:C3H1-type domain-containing protein n=1 Tax=Dendroctonus ponderosae TaxID=77166 RepID=A0AAR5Q0N1_DENPD|nr:protein suppressor of sable isoform X3 [Dendroctonus ponderosae]
MALVCDKTSMPSSDKPAEADPDIEDGEITDDDEDTPLAAPSELTPISAGAQPTIPGIPKAVGSISDNESIGVSSRDPGDPNARISDQERSDDKDRLSDGRERDRGRNKKQNRDKGIREDKAHRHMTEAERSILHLRKREKMLRQREKWDKHHRKEIDPADDDFAKNIEKTLATILNKKEKEIASLSAGEDVKEEGKRGKKRKRPDRDGTRPNKNKHKRSLGSPRSDIDENEILNIRSGSPGAEMRLGPPGFGPPIDHRQSGSNSKSDESYNSEDSDELDARTRRKLTKMKKKKETRRERRDQKRRDEQPKMALQDAQGVCVFYMQGKCQKNDCPYSHEVSPPMKLELCKFYLMDCCAKGENCSYMHSEFPCKFYHTGLACSEGKDCKFAHGQPLSEGLKQILFKHIETAPRDILQGFPRLSRDEALNHINQTQKKLTEQYSSNKNLDQNTSSSTTTLNRNSPTGTQQSYGGIPLGSVGLGVYRDDYGDNKETSDREKEEEKGGIPSLFDISVPVPRELAQGQVVEPKGSKNDRYKNKNSRWQQEQEHKLSSGYSVKSYTYGADQDMRYSGNGDIDMRTLPAIPSSESKPLNETLDGQKGDVDIRNFPKYVDIRQPPFVRNVTGSKDTDIRQRPLEDLQADSDKNAKKDSSANFTQTTKDLFARISANQKDNTVDFSANSSQNQQQSSDGQSQKYDEQNINWYSDDDDDDDNRLTIKVEDEEPHKREREDSVDNDREVDESKNDAVSPYTKPPIASTTEEIVGKLGDLSKIDISAEVTKLLTSMSQKSASCSAEGTSATVANDFNPDSGSSPTGDGASIDPRISRQMKEDPRQQEQRSDPRLSDPRQRGRQNSNDSIEKQSNAEKSTMSIYEQGGIDMKKAALDIGTEELKSSRPDIDLRNMSLTFKGMQNYTPATEIDASINSHPAMVWKVFVVEIPRPDYTGLKLTVSDAEKTGDPRLKKIFRLNIDEKDSPASPKASPKHSGGARIDPRLRKIEEKVQEPKDFPQNPQMSYNQQISMLRSSQFYQTLTSNQKLMLNQELARCDQSGGGGSNDPVLNTVLNRLNLIPQMSQPQSPMGRNTHVGAAASILTNIAKMNPMMSNPGLMGQPGLLGAAPGIPNIPPGMGPDYPMNFEHRGGPGLLGNAPPGPGFGQFGGMDQPPFGGYNDDFYGGYDDQSNMGPQGGNFRPGRGYNNRDNRRRGTRDGFRGGRGINRNFNKRGGGRDKCDRDRGRGNRGHSPG